MGSGFSKIKKQARLMQEQFSQAKNKMETTLVEGSAGNGLVVVTLNGAKELKKIKINPECSTDVEGLQDLILAAFEDATSKLETQDAMPGFPQKMPWS
jgi:DNA-binding YbaB/EbfC family protein